MKITDAQVSQLPVAHGRAELLEEVMSTPVIDRIDEAAPDGRRGHVWATVLVVAAAVALIIAAPLWVRGQDEDPPPPREPAAAGAPEGSVVGAPQGPLDRTILTAEGWTVANVSQDPKYGGEMTYKNGLQSFDVNWYPVDQHATYVEDRQRINHPTVDPGTPVDLLGKPSLLWPYSATDHAVIRPAEGKYFVEVRGQGMDRPAFLELLTHLRQVDTAGFEASLAGEFVTEAERPAAIRRILDDMAVRLPDGLDRAGITSSETDPYHLGADVTGTVACAWIAEFAAAKAAGAQARMAAAVDALQTSKRWPVLLEMDERGDYPEAIWEYADEVKAGTVPEGYRDGLGCG